MTDDAPSNAPSSISVILLLLRLLYRKNLRQEREPDANWGGERSFTYIFFSWERLLKAPVASRVVMSLLLRRLQRTS